MFAIKNKNKSVPQCSQHIINNTITASEHNIAKFSMITYSFAQRSGVKSKCSIKSNHHHHDSNNIQWQHLPINNAIQYPRRRHK